jgi:HEAT repeat protein
MKTKRLLFASAVILAGAMGISAQTTPAANNGDDDMKLIVLNSLRDTSPSVALPQIEKLLASDASLNVKRRALGILADMDTPAARESLGRIARGQSNPTLQTDAIRRLGDSGRADAIASLADIYGSTTNVEVKKSILRAFTNADDSKRLLGVAKNEKDPALRGEAVRQLGNLDARDSLMELYGTETSIEVESQILRGLSNSGAVDGLERILQTETSSPLRQSAIRELGNADTARTSAILSAQYDKEKDPVVRQAILRAFANRDDAKSLIAIARRETNPDLKLYAVRQLSNMDSKEAIEYLMEILNK